MGFLEQIQIQKWRRKPSSEEEQTNGATAGDGHKIEGHVAGTPMTPILSFAFLLEFLAEHMALPGRRNHVAKSGQRDMSRGIVGVFHFPLDG